MKDQIKNKLRLLNESSSASKWDELEMDVKNAIHPIIEKHKGNFGYDSYGVIDAINQVFEQMFERIKR